MNARLSLFRLAQAGLLVAFQSATAGPAAVITREPVVEPPTVECLGFHWIVSGDDNHNARVDVDARPAGRTDWKRVQPLFRVDRGAHRTQKHGTLLDVPPDGWLFAGSVLFLAPDTAYEIRLTLADPDGGSAERVLSARTRSEPSPPPGLVVKHVRPGSGGGLGTEADPYRGLETAQAAAAPGTLFRLHAGVYNGTFTARRSGEPGRPVVWRGAGDGETVIDGQGAAATRPGRAVSAGDIHDVWFENLTLRNADYGLVGHRSSRLVVRRCRIHRVDFGLTATANDNGAVQDFFVSDNVIEGPCTWPRTKGIENPRGIQITGTGHVICRNRVRGFADGIDTFPSPCCSSIDIHDNDIGACTDDGIELDYSERNVRCFRNRLTDVFQGISLQPVYGGPVYVLRNTLYNVCGETFKLHNSPNGAFLLHNTSVKKGMPLGLFTSEPAHRITSRNNLFVGTGASYAFECTAPMVDCDFDRDGFAGGPWRMFLKWNGVRYSTMEDAKKSPAFAHAVAVDAARLFESGMAAPADEKRLHDPSAVDLRLAAGSNAVDAGEPWPGLNDGFTGAAPDLGALERGVPPPSCGPRP